MKSLPKYVSLKSVKNNLLTISKTSGDGKYNQYLQSSINWVMALKSAIFFKKSNSDSHQRYCGLIFYSKTWFSKMFFKYKRRDSVYYVFSSFFFCDYFVFLKTCIGNLKKILFEFTEVED